MAKFFKTVLVEIQDTEVLNLVYPERIANKLTLAERLPENKCQNCNSTNWMILPKESCIVRESGKPYIECMNCGDFTHL